jgi:hypothetical protein
LIRYFDASALAKRYVAEDETARVRRLLGQGLPATSRYSQIEVSSALARRCREGAISAAERDRALAAVAADFAALNVVELIPEIAALANRLLVRHGLRSGDALQLASGLFLARKAGGRVEFLAFDERLAAAAEREGLAAPS